MEFNIKFNYFGFAVVIFCFFFIFLALIKHDNTLLVDICLMLIYLNGIAHNNKNILKRITWLLLISQLLFIVYTSKYSIFDKVENSYYTNMAILLIIASITIAIFFYSSTKKIKEYRNI